MHALLACGVAALALVVGDLALNGWRPRCARVVTPERGVVTLAVGVALLTPALVLLAEAGLFHPVFIGAFGWFAAAMRIAAHVMNRSSVVRRIRGVDALLAAGAVAFLIVAVHGRDEPWGQGRDQQVYADFAVLLAQTGNATLTARPADVPDAGLLRAIGADRSVDRYIGMTRSLDGDALEARSYLPLGWPVWLAFAYAIGGATALHAANAPVFLLGALLLFAVLRPGVGRPLAAGASLALLALPSSHWVAGIALSEPLAMAMWLTALALLALRGRRERLVPFVIFAATTIRLDALLLAPALIVARTVHAAMPNEREDEASARRFAGRATLASLGSIAWCAAFNGRYLRDAAEYVVPVALATVVAAGLAWSGTASYARLRNALTPRAAAIAAVAAVVFAVYCLWLRPGMGPFATIHNGSGLDGTRDFREDSLRNLAAYVGWPLMFVAIAGVASEIIRLARTPPDALARCALLFSGLAYAALYVYAPLVSPDQPWAIRRFVPVVIPVLVAFAAFALRSIVRQLPRASIGASLALVAAAASATVTAGTPLTRLKENEGAAVLIDAIDRRMPNDVVVATLPAANLGTVLAATRGRNVAVVDLERARDRDAVARWVDGKARLGKPAWILLADDTLPAGARSAVVGRWQYERRFIARAAAPPLRDVRTERVTAQLTRIDALEPGIAFDGFGGMPVFGIPDTGFLKPESTPFGVLRMTNGSASLDVAAALLDGATALEFTWFSWAPRGEARAVAVRIDGADAWRSTVAPGVSTATVPLPPSQSATTRVEIHSDAFDPRALDPRDYRDRVGIGVVRIRAVRR